MDKNIDNYMYFSDYDNFINEEAKHFLSGIVLTMENKILLVHPTKFKDKPGKWSIPKGHNEKDMTDLENALSELEEEANIKIAPFRLVNCKRGDLTYEKGPHSKSMRYYIVNINRSEVNFKLYNDMILRYYLNRDEISEAGFFSKQDALDLIEEHQKPLLNFL